MNVTYEKKNAMTFIGYHTEIRPNEGYVKCPEFWEKEYNQKYVRLWQTMKPETPVEEALLANNIGMFAICTESENGFDYWIAGLYQAMPEALQTLNTYVWQEWFPNEGQKFQANGMATLEVYSAGDPQSPDYECGIWVPVKKI